MTSQASYQKRLKFVVVNMHEVDTVMLAANWATSPGVFRPIEKTIEDIIAFFSDPTGLPEYEHDLPPLGITSIGDLVKAVTGICDFSKGHVSTLRIIGHGTPSGMQVGRDWIGYVDDVVKRRRALRLQEYAPQLTRLRPYFATNAKVVLEGCKAGTNGSLIKELSLLWPRVTVLGMTANQRVLIPGKEGGVRSCKNGVCMYTGVKDYELIDRGLGAIDRALGW
jgi:hypothetical protein